jgi:endonuclease/exonuclease/phosphatase family metal-dependent hydrolase
MQQAKSPQTLLFGILFLFFLQALSDFIQSIYAFGLLVTAFTAEVAATLLLFSPLVLVFFKRPPARGVLLLLVYTAILARLVEPLLGPGPRLVACGISVGAFLVFTPLLLHKQNAIRGWGLASGLALALAFSILFRVSFSGLDLSEHGMFQGISWFLGLLAMLLPFRMGWPAIPEPETPYSPASGFRISGLAIGLSAVIVMLYFVFASPAVLARWTGFSYPAIVITLLVVLVLFTSAVRSRRIVSSMPGWLVLLWNALFVLSLVLAILPHQVPLPLAPQLYPIDPPAVSPLAGVFLFLMLLSSPVLFVDFMLFARQVSLERPSIRQMGIGFSIASLFVLLVCFFQVFTTIYDYAPLVGPLFRDRMWLVYLLAGLGLFLPLFLLRKGFFAWDQPEAAWPPAPLIILSLALLTVMALFMTASRPVSPPASVQLKIMTYNIQQGFDKDGNQALPAQLAVVRSVDPDILGLQESDTARIANGNADAVRFFVDNLDMYSYYGPSTTTGTFGIALLSKYPIENPRTFFMYSEGEQTAAIQAEISANGKLYNVFVTHLGNSGPMLQLENMLQRIDALPNVIAMGDFNFRPPTDQYALMTATLSDCWLLKWPAGKEIPGYSPEKRIDHIFVSPGTAVLESEYALNPASDHPYMWTVIAP